MLDVSGVTVSYGDFSPVKNASFSLREGEWLMLCGPNGAGKSTLLNAVAGGCRYSGAVTLNGRNIRSYPQRELARSIGFLMQHNSVNYAFTVEEVVSLGRYPYRTGFLNEKNRQDLEKINEALDMTGLTSLKDQNVLTLSGGELQRTFLAQLFCQDPEILVLDEPANHLDPFYQKQLFTMIAGWLKKSGRAALSVVHDLSLARLFGTHALLMNDGEIVSRGSVSEALTREKLEDAYRIDMFEWLKTLYNTWNE